MLDKKWMKDKNRWRFRSSFISTIVINHFLAHAICLRQVTKRKPGEKTDWAMSSKKYDAFWGMNEMAFCINDTRILNLVIT